MRNRQRNMAAVLGTKGAITTGQKIQQDYPCVAEMYSSGKSLAEIALELDIAKKYDLKSRNTAASAVSYAIRGHTGEFGVPAYQGLIQDKSELERLAAKHQYENGKKLQEDKKGMFKLPKEEWDKMRKKASQKAYVVMLAEGTGILGRSKEKMQADSRKALKAKGLQPWIREGESMPDGAICTVSELEFMCKLSQQPEYKSNKYLKSAKIARELNKVYHNNQKIRTSRAVISAKYYNRNNKQ